MYTEAKVNIDERIEKGLTKFFKDKKQAKDLADKTNSYVYEVFEDEISTDKKGREIIISSFAGYGVPK
jgi:hypothetical protein